MRNVVCAVLALGLITFSGCDTRNDAGHTPADTVSLLPPEAVPQDTASVDTTSTDTSRDSVVR